MAAQKAKLFIKKQTGKTEKEINEWVDKISFKLRELWFKLNLCIEHDWEMHQVGRGGITYEPTSPKQQQQQDLEKRIPRATTEEANDDLVHILPAYVRTV